MPEPPIRVTHVIAGLGVGGAEMSLLKLLTALNRDEFPAEVISLTGDGPLGERIRSLDIRVTSLNFAPGRPDPRLILRLAAHLRRSPPDLIQAWMYHANLVGGLAARFAGAPPVVWGIHHAAAELRDLKPSTRWVERASASLSRVLPAAVVYCAESSRQAHLRHGYRPRREAVIPNGVDPAAFLPDPAARRAVRRELGLRDETPLIGLCARFHPDKDHQNFVRAAAILHRQMPGVHFVLWGSGVERGNAALSAWLAEGGLLDCVHLLGPRSDSPRLMASLDLGTLSSANEAFPLVIIEAMACEVPCAVTDVGDAAEIVGETGRVVPPGDPAALAAAWQSLLALPEAERRALGRRARQRVLDRFDLRQTAAAYARLYRDIIAGRLEQTDLRIE